MKEQIIKKFQMKVEFYDVDSMGVVWHGNYVKYIEKARCMFLESCNFTYIDMLKNGFVMPIVKMDFKYIKPLKFNEIFFVEIILIECECFLKFRYILRDINNNKVALANTSQVAIDSNTKLTLYEIPKILKQALI